jgi:hypothetical protein
MCRVRQNLLPTDWDAQFCTTVCRERYRDLNPARRQRYSSAHQRLRAKVAVAVEQGIANCARCGLPIEPGTDWDLDHNDDGRATEARHTPGAIEPRPRRRHLVPATRRPDGRVVGMRTP